MGKATRRHRKVFLGSHCAEIHFCWLWPRCSRICSHQPTLHWGCCASPPPPTPAPDSWSKIYIYLKMNSDIEIIWWSHPSFVTDTLWVVRRRSGLVPRPPMRSELSPPPPLPLVLACHEVTYPCLPPVLTHYKVSHAPLTTTLTYHWLDDNSLSSVFATNAICDPSPSPGFGKLRSSELPSRVCVLRLVPTTAHRRAPHTHGHGAAGT